MGGRGTFAVTGSAGKIRWRLDPGPSAIGENSHFALVDPRVRIVPRGQELEVFALRESADLGDVVLIAEELASGVEARFALTCVRGDLTAFRPRQGSGYAPHARTPVPDGLEESADLGPGIRVNGVGEVDPAGEDDLIEVVLTASHPVLFDFVRSSSALRLWSTPDRAGGTELAFAGDHSGPWTVPPGGRTVWVEWDGAHVPGLADLAVVPSGTDSTVDALRFHAFGSIVMVLGGEGQVPSQPTDPNHGTFLVGETLYGLGYDVQLYDEDAVGPTGAGAVYDEVVRAIQHRGVTTVASFGYSHGGGSTYDLAGLLDANRGGIGSFAIAYTSYVDGVENDSDSDVDMELRYPPGSGFHVNHYQNGTFADFFLDGGPVPGSFPPATGLDVETTGWGAGATHFLVDDYAEVLDTILFQLQARVNR